MNNLNFLNRKSARVALFFCLLAIPASVSYGQVKFARLFSDGAVLQRQKPIKVWGWAKAGESVAVSLAGQTSAATAGADGAFAVVFAPLEAGGPFELKATAPSGWASARNILIGEVWLCSGQSNMEWRVRQSDNFAVERKDAEFPQIRQFFVEHEVTIAPRRDLEKGEWTQSSADTVGDFTAIGFFFAREVYKKLKVPVGLVHSSWGGSQIEGWISREGMLGSDDLRAYAESLPTDWSGADAMLERRIKKATLGDENANPTLADERKYIAPGYDFSSWLTGGTYGQWDWQGIWAWRGNGYAARFVDVPAEWSGRETTLGFGELFGKSEVYVNGKLAFSGILRGKREIVVPRGMWAAGRNSLVVRMERAIEPEWYGIGFGGSRGDLFLASGAERIALDEQGWKLMPAFSEPHSYTHSSNNLGTTIYNGMIAPIVGYALRGTLWYQGETNAGRSYQYRRTFPLLIRDWRAKWGDDFEFYFVQLSSFGGNQNSNAGSGWAELREAQSMTLSVPKTGMAVTTDIGNANDVHPTNKQDVGRRLAAVAFSKVYGFDVPASGPVYEKMRVENGRAVLKFVSAYGGLVAKDRYGYVRGFEIAGADRKFYYARAEIRGDETVVWSDEVKQPVAVRYAWTDAPTDANLFNAAGFPASGFRTDGWPGITVNEKFR